MSACYFFLILKVEKIFKLHSLLSYGSPGMFISKESGLINHYPVECKCPELSQALVMGGLDTPFSALLWLICCFIIGITYFGDFYKPNTV